MYHVISKLEVTEKEISLSFQEKKKIVLYVSPKVFPVSLITEILKHVSFTQTSPEKDLPRKLKCTQLTKKGNRNKIVLTLNLCFFSRSNETETKKFIGFYYCNVSKIQIVNNDDKAIVLGFKSNRLVIFFFNSKENRDKFVKVVTLINAKYYLQSVKLEKIATLKDFVFFKENGKEYQKRNLGKLFTIYQTVKVKKHRCRSLYFNNLSERQKPTQLFLTENHIIEYKSETKQVLSKYPYTMIYKLVHYKKRFLIIEYYHNHPYVYQFEENKIFDEFLTSLLELCKRNKHIITVSTSPSNLNVKINGRLCDKYVREYYFKTINLIDVSTPNVNYKEVNQILIEAVLNLSLNSSDKVNKKIVAKMGSLLQIIQKTILSDESTIYNEGTMSYLYKKKEVLVCARNVMNLLLLLVTDKRFYASEILFDEKIIDVVWFLSRIEGRNLLAFYCFSYIRFCIDRITPYKKETKEKNAKTKVVNSTRLFQTLLRYKMDIKENSLPLYMALSVLDLCVFSAVSSTPRELFLAIIEDIGSNLDTMFFFMYFSKSCGIMYNSSVLIKVFLLEMQQHPMKFKDIRLNSLKSIAFLQNFYVCVNTEDQIQMACSSDILGLLSEENQFAMELYKRILPNSELLNELTRNDDNLIHSSTKIIEPKGKRLNLSSVYPSMIKKSWKRFILCLRGNYNSIYLVWNEDTRKELGKRLKKEINEFLKAQEVYKKQKLVWNFDEFKVQYLSLKDEPIVGKYFIKYLQEPKTETIILDPYHFMEQLHHELLFSSVHTIICLKSCTAVYTIYKKQIGVYPFMKNLCLFIETKIQNDKMVILETLNFLLSLFSLEQNIHNFIKFNGIEILIPFIDCIYDDVELKQKGVLIIDSKIDKLSINVRITKLCIEILIILVSFRLCVNTNSKVLVPIPTSIRKMCTTEIITKLTQFLLINDKEMFEKTIKLLTYLSSNENILVKLYETGFFFFVLIGNNDFYSIVNILSKLHLHQNVKLEEHYTANKKDYSPYIQSALNGILPREIIYQVSTTRELSKKKKQTCILRIAKVLSSENYESPRFIWNKKMRETLRNQIKDYLFKFFEEIKKQNYKGGQRNIDMINKIINREQICVNYPNLKNEFVCHHYYMRHFINMSKWEKNFVKEIKDDKVEMLKLLNSIKIVLRKRFDEKTNIAMCIKALLLLFQINENIFLSFHSEIDCIIKYLNELMFSKAKVDDNQVVSIYQSLWFLNLVFKKSFKKIGFSKVLNLSLQIITHVNKMMDVKKIDTLDKRLQVLSKNRKNKINEYNLNGLNINEKLYEVVLLCLKIIKFFTAYLFRRISGDFENAVQLILKIFLYLMKLPFEKTNDVKETIVNILQYFIGSRLLQQKLLIEGGLILFLLLFISSETNLGKKSTKILQKVCGFSRKSGVSVDERVKEVVLNLFPINESFTKAIEKRGKTPRELQLDKVKKSFGEKMNEELSEFLKGEIEKLGSVYSLDKLLSFEFKLLKNEIQSSGIFLKLFNLYKKDMQKQMVGKEFIKGILNLLKKHKNDKIKLKVVIETLYNATEFKKTAKYFKTIVNDKEFTQILVSCLDVSDSGLFLFTLKVILNFTQLELNKSLFKLLVDNDLFGIYKRVLFSKTKNTFHDWCRDVITLSLFNLTSILKDDPYFDKFSIFILFFLKVIFLELFTKTFSKRLSVLLSSLINANKNIEKMVLKILPYYFVNYFKEYPLIIVQILNRDFNFPEFIWNSTFRNKLKTHLRSLNVNDNVVTSVKYKLPFEIDGVFLSLYNERKDYPVKSFETFISKLVKSLKKKENVELKLLSLQNALGGEKYVNRTNLKYFKNKTKEFLESTKQLNEEDLFVLILRILSKLVHDENLMSELIGNIGELSDCIINLMKKDDKECYQLTSQILLKMFYQNEQLCKEINATSPLFEGLIRISKKKKDLRIARVLKVIFSKNEELHNQFLEEPVYQLFLAQTKDVDEKMIKKVYRIREAKLFKGNIFHYMKIEFNEKKISTEKENLFIKSKIISEKAKQIHRKTLQVLGSPSEFGRKVRSFDKNDRRKTTKNSPIEFSPSQSMQPKRYTPKRGLPTPDLSKRISGKRRPKKRLPQAKELPKNEKVPSNSDEDVFNLSDDDEDDDIISGEEEVLPEELNLDDYKMIVDRERKNEKEKEDLKKKKVNSQDYPDPFASDDDDDNGYEDPFEEL